MDPNEVKRLTRAERRAERWAKKHPGKPAPAHIEEGAKAVHDVYAEHRARSSLGPVITEEERKQLQDTARALLTARGLGRRVR